MSGHLKRCDARKAGSTPKLHLRFKDAYWPDFWLHIEASGSAKLRDLDQLLRDTWLECCGHLSSFTVNGVSYQSRVFNDSWGPPAKSMATRLDRVFEPGTSCRYVYDFGSSTELVGRCVRTLSGPSRPSVRVVARNLMPLISCESCEAEATMIDTWGAGQGLCASCSKGHDEEGLLPVVNSPRMGVCGYE